MRIFYILFSIILLTGLQAKSQVRSPFSDPETNIVKFYPNPAISSITFDIEKNPNQTHYIQIFNFLGKKIYEVSVNSRTIVDLTNFPRGIYIFQLKEQNGQISVSGKFQVAK
ncbi:MAG: T9SS type A sorting domain-containing protein [Puia sp.]|nr:T9SS type A sorting domain-containing protein [Puia sp.]